MGGYEEITMEGDIGGGLVLARDILLPQDSLNTIKISSSILARSVGAGSGGFSRLVCLRIHPAFKIVHPMHSSIHYTAIDGTVHELKPSMAFGESSIKGSDRPNGMFIRSHNFLWILWVVLVQCVIIESFCYISFYTSFTILIVTSPCAGEWKLLDSETGLGVVNRFDINQVALCNVKWGPGSVTLELWSEERPVSKDTPLTISHEYELIDIHE